MHSDLSQAYGKVPIDLNELNLDFATISAHKAASIPGAGALIFRKGTSIRPLIYGGGQEKGIRSGTENIFAIIAFGYIASVIPKIIKSFQGTRNLRDLFESEVLKHASNAKIYSSNATRLPNTSCIAMPSKAAQTQIIKFDLENIAVSSGAACSSGKVSRSHVLEAIANDDPLIDHAIRVSFGPTNTKESTRTLIQAWKNIYDQTKIRSKETC